MLWGKSPETYDRSSPTPISTLQSERRSPASELGGRMVAGRLGPECQVLCVSLWWASFYLILPAKAGCPCCARWFSKRFYSKLLSSIALGEDMSQVVVELSEGASSMLRVRDAGDICCS